MCVCVCQDLKDVDKVTLSGLHSNVDEEVSKVFVLKNGLAIDNIVERMRE